MKVIDSKQNDRPLYVVDPRDNVLIDIKGNHMELTLENYSILVLPSVETFCKFIGDTEVADGEHEVFLDKLMCNNCKITLTDYEMEDESTVSAVYEIPYDGETIYLLRIKLIENVPLYKQIEEGM